MIDVGEGRLGRPGRVGYFREHVQDGAAGDCEVEVAFGGDRLRGGFVHDGDDSIRYGVRVREDVHFVRGDWAEAELVGVGVGCFEARYLTHLNFVADKIVLDMHEGRRTKEPILPTFKTKRSISRTEIRFIIRVLGKKQK